MGMDIKPVRNQIYDCFSANLVTISRFKKKDCYMWFANRVNLNFNSYQQECLWNILKNYHGITKCEGIFNINGNFINYVREELSQDNPIIMATDIYNCPWNAYYKKRHYTHYIQIIDYNETSFICLDPFFSNNQEVFPIYELKAEIKFIVLRFGIQRESLLECLSYVRYFLSLYADKIAEGELDINYVEKAFSNKEKVQNNNDMYEMYNISAVNSLVNLDNNRGCFVEMLKEIQTRFKLNLNDFINRINDINTNLRIIRAKVLRQALVISVKDMAEENNALIEMIVQNEKEWVLDFLNYINTIIL